LLSRTTALENVEVPLLYSPGMGRRQRRVRAEEGVARVGVARPLHHPPDQLSGGQPRRGALAPALVNRPPILFLGEPRGNHDTRTSGEIMGFFREPNKVEGITIILVTHDPEVARLADRAIVLVDGEVVVDTTDIALATEAIHKRAAMDEDA